MEVESNKGKRAFIFHGNKYRSYYISKVTGIESWRCTQKICKARIQTKSNEVSNKTELYKEIGEHNHSEKTTNVAVVVTRVACKRKSVDTLGMPLFYISDFENFNLMLKYVSNPFYHVIFNIIFSRSSNKSYSIRNSAIIW